MPSDEGEYGSILARPAVQARLHELGVRYLVVVASRTWHANEHGGIFCGGGYGGGGCLGLATYEKLTSTQAQVWDLTKASIVTRLGSEASGQAVIPALLLPLPPYIPATRGAACDTTAEQILDLLGE
jgi:hypothetical protein